MAMDAEASPRVPPRTWGARRTRLRRTLRKPQFWLGSAVLVPTLLWYALFQFGPVVEAVWLSLHRVTMLNLWGGRFVGFTTIINMLVYNQVFGLVLLNTAIWTALQFAIVLPLALLTALCLTTITRGRTVCQVVLFLPFITPAVVVGQIMGQFFAPGGGLASVLLRGAGLPWRWVGDPAFAGVLGVFTGAWHWVGFYTVVLVAGLLNIPREVSDAARVDGARGWGLFRRITLPLTGQIMVLVLLLLVLNAVQEPVGIAGQPLVTSTLKDIVFGGLVTFGAGAAGGVIVAVATLAVSVAIIALVRPRWSY